MSEPFSKSSLSGRTLYEFMRCNSTTTGNSVNPLHAPHALPRVPPRSSLWKPVARPPNRSTSSSRPFIPARPTHERSSTGSTLRQLANECAHAYDSTHLPRESREEASCNLDRLATRENRESARSARRADVDLTRSHRTVDKVITKQVTPKKAPPMFEQPKERRGTRLSHLKGSSPGQLTRRIEKRLARRISRTPAVLLSMDDLHRAVLLVDFSNLSSTLYVDDQMFDDDIMSDLEAYKQYQSHVLLIETMEGFSESLHNGYGGQGKSFYQTVNIHVTGAVRKGRDWALTLQAEDGSYVSSGDVVLLFRKEDEWTKYIQLGVARAGNDGQGLFGIVDRTSHGILLKVLSASPESRWGYAPSDCAIGSQWTAVVVHSLLTVEREWRALVELPAIPTMIDTQCRHEGGKQLPGVNQAQAMAIHAVLATEPPIVLIQGPPGTGKTHTLVCLLKMLCKQNMKKILIAAPSNAAVDELMARFVLNSPADDVLRIGRHCREELKKFSLDTMLNICQTKAHSANNAEYREKKTRMIADIVKVGNEIGSAPPGQKAELIRARDRMKQNLDKLQTREESSDKLVKKLLSEKKFIFGTLSSFGSDSVWTNLLGPVDVCLIDEAAQAIEVSTLIPLKFKPKKLVLVGDPQQLPAVIKSSRAKQIHRFDLSLMERLMNSAPQAVIMLREQYRMHHDIALFPSRFFYDNLLETKKTIDLEFEQIWGNHRVVFLDVPSSTDIKSGTSMMNPREARICADFVKKIARPSLTIGVISPYKQQVFLLRSLLDSLPNVEIDSVDAFQGREKDVIVFNCVRASGNSVGFLADQRRLNVAITRAKKGLVIVGNAAHLSSTGGPVWKSLIDSVFRIDKC